MKLFAIRTGKIEANKQTISAVLDEYVKTVPENSVLAVTSKIVSLCEGNVVPMKSIDKQTLVEREAELYLPPFVNSYGSISFTIKNSILIPSAGIDESNGNGYYILWPKDPQASANKIREYLVKRFHRTHVGVVITDSKTTPLRWGVTGVALSHSGFSALNDYIGRPDIFGRPMVHTKVNTMDALAAAAVYEMGETNEQTPLVVIEDIRDITFQSRNPSLKELEMLNISLDVDVYAPIIQAAPWKKGKSRNVVSSSK